jgi:hypothetical protein
VPCGLGLATVPAVAKTRKPKARIGRDDITISQLISHMQDDGVYGG